MNENQGKVVFATIGTTKFDLLITKLTEIETLQLLQKRGYTSLIIQKGNGVVIPSLENAKKAGVKLSYYDYKDSIKEDILMADLVISHAGAGTCLEVLGERKPLLVVVNEELMNNHQTELADQLSSDMYLFSCTCKNLRDVINSMDLLKLRKMEPTNENLFAKYLNDFMGFQEDETR